MPYLLPFVALTSNEYIHYTLSGVQKTRHHTDKNQVKNKPQKYDISLDAPFLRFDPVLTSDDANHIVYEIIFCISAMHSHDQPAYANTGASANCGMDASTLEQTVVMYLQSFSTQPGCFIYSSCASRI